MEVKVKYLVQKNIEGAQTILVINKFGAKIAIAKQYLVQQNSHIYIHPFYFIGSWKGGKFMPLSQRPFSINTYALPKIWFRCHSLELRAGDFVKINSCIKSWLYADLLEKPEELVLFRPKMKGGLGVHNAKYKALAILIRSFLETAVNTKFINNLYHNALYRWHVLGDHSLRDPGSSPYYSPNFFSAIKQVVQAGLLNVSTMTTKQWYRVLMEENITMELDAGNKQVWKPVKCEIAHPVVSWDRSWGYALHHGLSSDQSTFIFKMLHNILPTAARLHRLKQKENPTCTFCSLGVTEDLAHALVACSHNTDVNNWIIEFSHKVVPNCTVEDIIHLNFELPKPLLFPLVWSLAHILSLVWQLRTSKKTISLFRVRSEIEARINTLRKSRLADLVSPIKELLNL